jgi:hypothetical protein
MTANVVINIVPLTDNEVWFANAAAWNNYWNNVDAEVEFDAITTIVYTPSAYNTGLQPIANVITDPTTGADVVQITPTKAMFDSLRAQVTALDTAFQTMRTELKNGGLITEAQ